MAEKNKQTQTNVVEQWKTGSISQAPSTVSSFRGGEAYSGALGGALSGALGGATGAVLGVDEDIANLVNAPAEEIQRYSNLLKGAKYLKSATKKYNKSLGTALVTARSDWETEAARTGRPDLTFEQFLIENAQAGGGTKNVPTEYQSISGRTAAQNMITDVWKRELGREPTAVELSTYTKKLQKAQAKNPTKQTYEIVNGKRVQKTISGLDEGQYLTNQVRKTQEFSEKKAQARLGAIQELAATAAANGLNLTRDFGTQVDVWAKQIQDGTDINSIKNIIRQTAKLGMPDRVSNLLDQGVDLETIYSPYKRIMASVLEVNPDAIDLNDPTLRGAIGPDREKTLYDFQRELRKDPRWQYTNNAREEVSNAALGILRDFGFQG